jgi:uncharacterized membrane protein YhaH (DUF805 family)
MFWITTATTVKRLHDRDRRGYWAIPIVILNRLALLYYVFSWDSPSVLFRSPGNCCS